MFKLLDIPDEGDDEDDLDGIEDKSEQERESKLSGIGHSESGVGEDDKSQ